MSQDAVATQTKTILVVEDDESIGEVIQLVLSQETDYASILVANSYQALKVANKTQPNLFIIDYRLSDMNGIELYDKLHTFEKLQNVPAIITSASIHMYEPELQERNLTGLAKPFDLDELLGTIKLLIG